jgi:hypothetical protein
MDIPTISLSYDRHLASLTLPVVVRDRDVHQRSRPGARDVIRLKTTLCLNPIP